MVEPIWLKQAVHLCHKGRTSSCRAYLGDATASCQLKRRIGVGHSSSKSTFAGAPKERLIQGVTADRLRTAIARACTAAGVPAFSPDDLRHRRISLLHLSGVPWARIGEHVGQRNLAVTANTYTHVLVDENEIDYTVLLSR